MEKLCPSLLKQRDNLGVLVKQHWPGIFWLGYAVSVFGYAYASSDVFRKSLDSHYLGMI